MQELIDTLMQMKDELSQLLHDDNLDKAFDKCILIARQNMPNEVPLEQIIQRLQGKVEAYETALECMRRN